MFARFLHISSVIFVSLPAWDCKFFSYSSRMQNERYGKKYLMLALFANVFAVADAALTARYRKRRLCHPLTRFSIRYRTLFHIKLTEDYFLTNVKCFIFGFFFPSFLFDFFFDAHSHFPMPKLCPFSFVANALWEPIFCPFNHCI